MFTTLLHNLFFTGISSVLRFLGNVVFFLVVAHFLGVAEFGKITLAIAFCQLFLSAIDFGYNLFIAREVSIEHSRLYEYHKTIIASKLLLTVGVSTILGIVQTLLEYSTEQQILIWIVWIGTIFYSFGYYYNSVFRGVNQFQYETIAVSLFNAFQFGIIFFLIWLSGNSTHVVLLYTSVRFLYVAISYYLFRKHFTKNFSTSSIQKIRSMMTTTLPFGVHAILGVVYLQLDTIFISYFRDSTEVGLYQSGMRLVIGSMVLYEIGTAAFYPLLSQYYEKNTSAFHAYATVLQKYMTLLGVAISLPLLIYTEEIIPLLFGQTFIEAGLIIRLLAVVIFLRFFAATYGVLLTVSREQTKRAMGVLLSVLVNVLGNYLLVQHLGGMGAAITSIITHAILFFIYFYYSYKCTLQTYFNMKLVGAIGFVGTAGVASYLLKHSNLLFSVSCSIISFIAVTAFLLNVDERKKIQQLIQKFIPS